jgi:hypothetical protein
VQACRCVDTRDPQGAELPLALAPVAVLVLAGLDDRLLGGLEKFAASAVVALGFREDFLMACFGGNATLYSCHVSISSQL